MSEAGGLDSTDFRLGYHKPIDRPWQPVIYSAVDIGGTLYAVLDGCILIGTVDEQERLVQQLRALGNPAQAFTEPGFTIQAAGIKGAAYRWKNATVPYEIAGGVPQQERITGAITHWQDKSKVRFTKKSNGEQDWVRFIRGPGCASYVGRQGGLQTIVIGDACSKGNMIHEIGHCIGLYHEQSRSDRDDWVEIKWTNIDATKRHNFNKEDSLNLSGYDYGSIMHYPKNAFSTNSQDTIVAKRPLGPGVVMGQRNGLSEADIAAVAQLYP